jgi:hypothetical protein
VSDLTESARVIGDSLRGVREAAEQLPRQLHDVLDHHRKTSEEQLTRFEAAVELHALALLLQTETFGPSGTAMPLANALDRLLRNRGVLP